MEYKETKFYRGEKAKLQQLKQNIRVVVKKVVSQKKNINAKQLQFSKEKFQDEESTIKESRRFEKMYGDADYLYRYGVKGTRGRMGEYIFLIISYL